MITTTTKKYFKIRRETFKETNLAKALLKIRKIRRKFKIAALLNRHIMMRWEKDRADIFDNHQTQKIMVLKAFERKISNNEEHLVQQEIRYDREVAINSHLRYWLSASAFLNLALLLGICYVAIFSWKNRRAKLSKCRSTNI